MSYIAWIIFAFIFGYVIYIIMDWENHNKDED